MKLAAKHGAIVILGVSGCGKSTVGRLLADDLRCPFIEGDDLHSIESIAKMSAGIALTDDDRIPWLDRLAAEIRASLTQEKTVVATCSALKKSYRDRLRKAVDAPLRYIFLDANPDEIRARLAGRTAHFFQASLLDSQFNTLEPPTADEGALTLRADSPPQQLCAAIRVWLAAELERNAT